MTRNPRDHREWTNAELQEESAGYLAARQAYREAQAKATEKRIYQDDLDRFREAFVASGGDDRAAAAAFKAHRNERAAEAADEAAGEQSRRYISQAL